jgi:hypothetical protein
MSRLELKLEGWGDENLPAGNIDTEGPVSPESKPISRFDGHECGYTYVGTTDYSEEKVFEILNDYLQPDTTSSLHSAVHSILALLPENAPLSTEVWNVGEVVLHLAKQIPYHHPSQIKLARIMEELTCSPKFASGLSEKVSSACRKLLSNNHDTVSECIIHAWPAVQGVPARLVQRFVNAFHYQSHIQLVTP